MSVRKRHKLSQCEIQSFLPRKISHSKEIDCTAQAGLGFLLLMGNVVSGKKELNFPIKTQRN